jgi:hypothetical protein
MRMPEIRVHNATGADLDSVRLYTPEPREAVDFGRVADGELSEYRKVPIAYRFAEVEASAQAESFSLRPYDFVGERPLPEGRYTYRLGKVQEALTLDLQANGSADQ